MKSTKTALALTASFGVVLAGSAANAETTRAAVSMPVAVAAKKIKPVRVTAPVARESRAMEQSAGVLAIGAAGLFGFAVSKAIDGDDSSGG